MGQIVFNGQKPKYCNLQSIQTGGQHVSDDVAIGEIWLVDTTNSDKGLSGKGKYDAYIIGDGIKKAGQLTLNYIDTPIDMSRYSTTLEMQAAIQNAINSADIPRNLSDLSEDSTHRTVTDAEKAAWNSSGGGGGGNPVDDEDLTLALQDSTSVIKFKDRAYSPANYSSLGRKYLRKNIQTVSEKSYTIIAGHHVENPEYEFTNGGVIDISTKDIGTTISLTPSGAIDAVYAYCIIDVDEGDSFLLQSFIGNNNYVRAWGFIDSNNVLLSKSTVRNAAIVFGSEVITAPANTSKLIVNVHRSYDINYKVAKVIDGESKELNLLTQEMFDSPNTAYIIQYDYTINFGTITLPEGSVLIFDGGSISNGAIIGNHSKFVEEYNRQIFNLDTCLCGTWDTENFYPEYFGAVGDGVMDCYLHIQKCLDTIHYISTKHQKTCMLPKTYKITNGLLVYPNTRIKGNSNSAWTNVSYTLIADFENKQQWIIDSASISWKDWQTYPIGEVCPYDKFANANATDSYVFQDNHNIVIETIAVGGQYSVDENEIRHYIFGGIRIQRSNHSHMTDVYVDGVWIGVAHAAQWYSSDRDLWISARNIAMYFASDCNHFTLYNGYINSPSNFSNVDVSEYSAVNGQLDKPTNVVCHYSSGNIINPITEGGGYAYGISGGGNSSTSDNKGSNLYLSNPYIEGAYDIFFTMAEFTKCTVLNGVFVSIPKQYFAKGNGNGCTLRLVGDNFIDKIVNAINKNVVVTFDNLHSTSNSIQTFGNFGTSGALIYSTVDNKFYMIGHSGITGVDGYQYQTKFSGSELPSEMDIKVGTPFMLQQSDRIKPVFESISSKPAWISIKINTLPSVSGNVTFNILGTARTVTITYFEGVNSYNISAQIYRGLSRYYKCFKQYAEASYHLDMYIPYETYQNSEVKTFSFEDTGATGLDCSISIKNGGSPVKAQYVDYLGNSGTFEYKFSDLPATALEGTIGYWTVIQQPVYFKKGGWYDFPTNTKQELTFDFSDHTTEKSENVTKTGGTFSYIVESELNNSAVNIIASNGFDNLISHNIVNNQDGTFNLTLTVAPTVYTSVVEVPVYIYQLGTGKKLTVTFSVAAGDNKTNVVIDNETVKTKFVGYDTDNDGELSYDEALLVTKFTGQINGVVGTASEHVIIDFRPFSNLENVTENSKFANSNHIDIIFPASLTILGNNTAMNIFKYMAGSNNTLVLLSVNPPRITGVGFGYISKIYVPDISVDLYKDYTETTGDTYPSSKIFPISEIDDNDLRAKLGLEPITESQSEEE